MFFVEDDFSKFIEVVNRFIAMGQIEYNNIRENVIKGAKKIVKYDETLIDKYSEMLESIS